MRKFFPFGIIFLVVFFLFYPTLSTYFSQDDFFMFKVSQTDGSLGGFINLFSIKPFEERGLAFYRPIFREALHNIYFTAFGLNHLPFRIVMLVIHSINTILIYILVKKLFKDQTLAYLSSFFFGTASANSALLYYLAGGIEAGGAAMFALLSLILFWSYLQKHKVRLYIFSLITFLLAIFSHEIVASVGIVIFLMFLFTRKANLKSLILFIPVAAATSLLLYIDLSVIGLSPGEKEYMFIFNLKTITNSLSWYFLWALGLPETLIDFVGPGLRLNPTLMRYWGNFYSIIFPAAIVSFTLFFLSAFYLLWKNKTIFYDKKLWFFLLWFPAGLLPVIFLPGRRSTHYLVFALPAFWVVMSFLILNFYRTISKHSRITGLIGVSLTIISVFILSSTSIRLLDKTYWAAQRGRIAEKLINDVKTSYPNLPKRAVIYFINDPDYPFLTKEWGNTSKQASLILNGSDALRLFYKDPTLKVFYEDLGGPPGGIKKELIYTITAKIN